MKKSGLILSHLKPADYIRQPWKNGKGFTRQIAAGEGDPSAWRLSLATVPGSGPFSLFPDYDRNLTLLGGGPMSLSHDGRASHPLALFVPYPFPGDVATIGVVDSPAEDFNLLTHRKKAQGGVYVSRMGMGEEMQFPLQRNEHFLYCAEGEVEVLDPNSQIEYRLSLGDTLWLHRGSKEEYLNLRATSSGGPALVLWIVVRLF